MPITRVESNENEIVLNLRDTHQKSIQHTHTQRERGTNRMCVCVWEGKGGTTPYAGENKMAAGLLEAWGGMRHAACIFNVAPASASQTNHDAWLAKSKCLPLAKESVCISNDNLRLLPPPQLNMTFT